MPFFLDTDDREKLGKLAHEQVCQECGKPLEVRYYPDLKKAGLQCSENPDHRGIAKPNQKEDKSYEGGIRQMLQVQKTHGEEKARTLAKYQGVTALSRVQAMEILDTIWPSAPQPDKMAAAILCQSYGLNPLANHIFLIPYEKKDKDKKVISVTWSRVWGIRAKRLVASRKGGYSYLDMSPRLMTEAEQTKVWGAPDKAHLCYITILKDTATGAEVYGFGKWPLVNQWGQPNEPKGTDKGNSMANMASIRSEAQALDRLRPAEMPTGDEVADEQFVEVNGQTVEKATGQVIEGEAIERPLISGEDKPGVVIVDTTISESDKAFNNLAEERTRIEAETRAKSLIDIDWVRETLPLVHWKEATLKTWVKQNAALKDVNTEQPIDTMLASLNAEQAKVVHGHLQGMREASGK